MGQVTATISVKDTQVVPVAVDDVLVKVYDADGVFVTSGSTGEGANEDGEVEFELTGSEDGTSYTLRFRKDGASITNPQAISVTDPADPSNIFDVTAELHTLPTADDANMCRCSGYFVDASGAAIEDLRILFRVKPEIPEPQILGSGNSAKGIVGGHTVVALTDSSGYVQLDLPRDGEFDAVVGGQENERLHVVVPDAASASLVHLLWPIISNIVYDPVSPAAVATGETTDVGLALTWSSGVTKFTGAPPMEYTSSDNDVATASVSGTDQDDATLTIRGVSAGQATLTPTRTYVEGYETVARPAVSALPTIVVNVA